MKIQSAMEGLQKANQEFKQILAKDGEVKSDRDDDQAMGNLLTDLDNVQ